MSAEIIPFPVQIERLAQRIARIMAASTADCEEGKFTEAMDDLGIGMDGGMEIADYQWKVIWPRVHELLSCREKGLG